MVTTTTGLATSFITFSRPGASGGGATTTDRDGKIKWAGHNLLTNSESFDASAWGKYLTTVTANSTAAPNGTTTADTIATTSSNATIYQSSVIPVGTSTFSCWFKAGTLTSVKVIFDGGAGTGREAAFTLSGSGTAGAVANSGSGAGTLSGGTSSITPLSDGWYLCTIAGVTTTAAAGLTLLLATSGNVIAWGAHLYRSDLGGMQLNPAMPAGMQSYYPTTPPNALGWTEDFSNAAWSKQDVTITSNAAVSVNGLQTADRAVYAGGLAVNAPRVQQSVTMSTANAKTTLSVWVWGSGKFRLKSTHGGVADNFSSDFTATSTPTRYSLTVTNANNAGTGQQFCAVVQASDDSAFDLYLWGAQLSDSASLDTYVPVYGAAVTSAAYYAPRLDFDPVTLAAKGLLVEEARTNILQRTAEFDNAYWSKTHSGASNPVVTANSVASPDGTTTADKVEFPSVSGAGAYALVSTTFTATANANTASIWLRGNVGGEVVWIAYTPDGSNYNRQSCTLTTSWQRFSLTATLAVNTYNIQFGVDLRDGSQSAKGAQTIYAWGAQLEQNASFATSYIPTGSATATRAADVASVSTGAFPYSASEGTLVANFSWIGGSASNPFSQTAVSLWQSSGNQIVIYNGDSVATSYCVLGGADQAYLMRSAVSAGVSNKVGFAFKANDFAAVQNGGAAATDTTGTLPSPTTLAIGNSGAPSAYLNGHLRQITYLPRRISNAELQSRSA